ncbi:hypothetical protein VCRA217O17_90066 [Vibrio crassostreae]|nr:hypothetical protein VCRA217O17_90066 [Vibrio crassostreae]
MAICDITRLIVVTVLTQTLGFTFHRNKKSDRSRLVLFNCYVLDEFKTHRSN